MERFGFYEIAQGADTQPVALSRSPDEFVFLAFDTRIKRLVELHVLKSGERLRPAEKRSAFERVQLAAELSNASFIRILEYGEDGDVVYYSSSLNDGEPLEAYIQRRGPLPPATIFSLLMQLLDDVILLQQSPRLLAGIRLSKLFITLQEETFLQLRVLDFGLSSPELGMTSEEVAQRVVHETCLLAFLLLTGRPYAGDDCDRIVALTGLPSGLRTILRTSLAKPDQSSASIQRLRDEIRDALTAQTRDLQGRASRRHLVAVDSMLPQSALRDILLHDVRIEQLLKGRLVAESAHAQQRYPFTFQGVDARTEVPLNVHLLPPRRIVSNEHYDAVPLQMWRFNPDKHPNILRSLSLWESPDLTFLTEEHSPGFPLSRLIAERVALNPAEVLILLRQVNAGIEQALDCGVEKLDLHPCNIFLKLAGAPHAREMEKLLQKRFDAWPKFTVMLRPHMTMRSLYEPLLVEGEADNLETREGFFDAMDFRNRSYVALAAYLLSGERQVSGHRRLPESLPEELIAYVNECQSRARIPGRAPTPQEFLQELEKRTAVPEAESAEKGLVLPARRMPATRPIVTEVPMESAGSVSDFEEDNLPEDAPPAPLQPQPQPRRTQGRALPLTPGKSDQPKFPVKSPLTMLLWAALVIVLVFIAYAVFSGDDDPGARDAAAAGKSATLPEVQGGKSSPATHPQTGRSMTPEEVRPALLPSEREKDELRKQQQKPSASIGVQPPAAQAVLQTAGKDSAPSSHSVL